MTKVRPTLTKKQAQEILENPVETGYTYAESLAYRRKNHSAPYIHPRMGRRPIKWGVPNLNFDHSVYEMNLTSSSSASIESVNGTEENGNDTPPIVEIPDTPEPPSLTLQTIDALTRNGHSQNASLLRGFLRDYHRPTGYGSGTQRTVKYVLSVEEEGDKSVTNKTVDETIEFLSPRSSSPQSSAKKGILKTSKAGASGSGH